MNLLRDLFDLRLVDPSDPNVQFSLARPIPAWGWLVITLAAFSLAVWSYTRLAGPRGLRLALGGIRAILLLALVLIITGPRLERPNERVEQDWLVALVDRSASLGIRDGPGGTSREDQLRAALRDSRATWREVGEGRNLLWMGFDAGAFELRSIRGEGGFEGLDLGEADGARTAIGQAIDRALARTAARPVSGIVIFSDGRSIDAPSRAALRRLESEQIPVIVLPLGSREMVSDIALAEPEAPSLAFVNDTVPVTARVERTGQGSGRVRIQLIDKATGAILDERTLDPDDPAWEGDTARIALASRPGDPGAIAWRIRATSEGPDLIDSNNEGEVRIDLVDRPLRIVYLDGYPRWEYRYIKNLLVREASIESSVMMASGRRSYIKEGSHPIESIPRSPEEWARFDVVILGDLASQLLTSEQMAQLREHIALRGAGLLWIGGPSATPHSWHGTPLADLLPFRTGPSPVPVFNEPVTFAATPTADRLGLLQLGEPPESAWPEHLRDPRIPWSRLHWCQRIEPASLKATAEVLATATPASAWEPDAPSDAATPSVISMRYGAGRVLYIASDEIWRWRYARGEALPERFWLPLLRLQGRESLAQGGAPALLTVEPRRAAVGQPVRIEVKILDQSLAEAEPRSIAVRLRATDDPDGFTRPVELTLLPEGGAGDSRSSVRVFASTWAATQAGRYQIEVSEPLLQALSLSASLEVALPDDELRHAQTDHASLESLAGHSGGRVLTTASITELPTLLPRREIRIQGQPDVETLWDKGVVLAFLISLLVVEWITRRFMRLA